MKEDTPDGSLAAEDTPTESSRSDEGTPPGEEHAIEGGKVDWEKRYRDLEAAFTKGQQELAPLRETVAELKGRVFANPVETRRDPDFLDRLRDPKTKEDILSDPGLAVDLVEEGLKYMAGIIRSRDDVYEGRLSEMTLSASPEKDQIEELRKDERFANLPISVLRAIIEKQSEGKPESPVRPRGSLNGGRRAVAGEPETDVRKSPLYGKIYGDRKLEVI